LNSYPNKFDYFPISESATHPSLTTSPSPAMPR
jgi:hypothetical protein